MDKRTQLMASQNISGAIWRLAAPAIISMAVMAIYNMADTYFVSLVSGRDLEVAAVSVFLPILLITQSVSVLFAAGGAAYLSRQLGARDTAGANRTVTTTIVLSFLCGSAVLVLGLVYCESILIAFGASSDTLPMAKDYAMIMFLASPIQLTNMSFNNLLRAEGNAVRSMTGMVTGALLNIVLDAFFIITLGWGLPGRRWRQPLRRWLLSSSLDLRTGHTIRLQSFPCAGSDSRHRRSATLCASECLLFSFRSSRPWELPL